MFSHHEFEAAAKACDEALRALEFDDVVAANIAAELDRVLHMLSSLALSEADQSWRAVVDNLITRRLALERTDGSLASLGG